MVKLDTKLREMNVVNLDSLHVFYSSMFSSPPPQLENEFADLLMAIGSWPQVSLFSYFTWLLALGFWPFLTFLFMFHLAIGLKNVCFHVSLSYWRLAYVKSGNKFHLTIGPFPEVSLFTRLLAFALM